MVGERRGFIGLGVMGGPMASNLIRALARRCGSTIWIQVRSLGSSSSATAASSPSDVAANADVVFLSLPSIAQVEVVVDQILAAEQHPRLVVDMSTSDLRRTREVARRLADGGIAFLDAPVARLRQAAVDGTLLITVGGSAEDLDAVRPLLQHMASDILHCGEVGSGQLVKILNNMVVFLNVRALAEAITIGRAAGVDGARLMESLTMGSADSFALRNPGMKSLATDEFPTKAFPAAYALKDIRLALAIAEEHGVRADAAAETAALFEALIDQGLADEYYPAIVKLLDGR